MQAFGLSLIKGRLGSDQERREIQTPPERKRARGPVFGALRRTKTSNAAAVAIGGVRPRSCREEGSRDGHPLGPLDLGRRWSAGEQILVKAGLRTPPPAASALTRLRPPAPRAAREIEAK